MNDLSKVAHDTFDRMGYIEAKLDKALDKLGAIEPRVLTLENKFDEQNHFRSEVITKLNKLGEASDNALKSLEQWATIRRTLAWVGGILFTAATTIGAIIGWLYHDFWTDRAH